MKHTLLAALSAVSMAWPFGATQAATAPLNFQTQALQIFHDVTSDPALHTWVQYPETPKQKAALETIYQELLHHQIYLKNVVYRKDTNVIRITYGDDSDHYVFKISYKTNTDSVLTNSLYADKRQLIDVKIMYRDGDQYDYLHLDNQREMVPAHFRVVPSSPLARHYRLETRIGNAECGFCHTLARNDGSPSGLFFVRYQESNAPTARYLRGTDALFKASDFQYVPTKLAAAQIPGGLPGGLPPMIHFNQVHLHPGSPQGYSPLTVEYTRTIFEMPELVEVLARDNHKSYCISVDFSTFAKEFSNSNYVCADDQHKKLYVRFSNPYLTTGLKTVQYVKPFYIDPENVVPTVDAGRPIAQANQAAR